MIYFVTPFSHPRSVILEASADRIQRNLVMRGPYRSLHSLQGDKETDPGTEAGMTFPLADTALIAYSFPPALSPGPRSGASIHRFQNKKARAFRTDF